MRERIVGLYRLLQKSMNGQTFALLSKKGKNKRGNNARIVLHVQLAPIKDIFLFCIGKEISFHWEELTHSAKKHDEHDDVLVLTFFLLLLPMNFPVQSQHLVLIPVWMNHRQQQNFSLSRVSDVIVALFRSWDIWHLPSLEREKNIIRGKKPKRKTEQMAPPENNATVAEFSEWRYEQKSI